MLYFPILFSCLIHSNMFRLQCVQPCTADENEFPWAGAVRVWAEARGGGPGSDSAQENKGSGEQVLC